MSLLWGTLGGLIAAMATVAGAVPSLFKTRKGISISTHVSMDFALGMMLAAAAFSLILPAGEQALARGTDSLVGVLAALAGGATFIRVLGKFGAHFTHSGNQRFHATSSQVASNKAWLFIVAMMLHNFPEGLASGSALAGLNLQAGIPILAAIALQNLPEGLTTAITFQALGASVRVAFIGACVSALVELFGGAIGGALLHYVDQGLPFILGFAGGAMLYVALQESIHRYATMASSVLRIRMARDLGLGMGLMFLMSRLI